MDENNVTFHGINNTTPAAYSYNKRQNIISFRYFIETTDIPKLPFWRIEERRKATNCKLSIPHRISASIPRIIYIFFCLLDCYHTTELTKCPKAMTSSATNSQSGSSNRLLNDLPHPDPESGVISIKCLRKIFKVNITHFFKCISYRNIDGECSQSAF